MLKGVHTVLLYVRNVQASLAFYRDKLGFPLEFTDEREGGVAGLRLGGVRLILHSDQGLQQGYLPPPPERGRGVILHFEVESVDNYHQELQIRGVAISKEPEDQAFGLRTMYLYDPDGYNLCFVQRLS